MKLILPKNPRLLAAAALVANQHAKPQHKAPALFITHQHTEELVALREEVARLRAAAPAELPPRAIGEYRRSTRTLAERDANVAKVLKTERDATGVIRHNSLREMIKWHSKPGQWFAKPVLEIWSK